MDRVLATLPNALSTLRLALAFAFPFLPASWRLPVVILGGFSDWLDGFLARRLHAESALGGVLDAVADKAFAFSVLFTLASVHVILPWQVGVVILRDIAVALISLVFALRGQWGAFGRMPSRIAGKVTTALLFLWLIAVLVPLPDVVTLSLFFACGASSLAAAVDYLLRFKDALRADQIQTDRK